MLYVVHQLQPKVLYIVSNLHQVDVTNVVTLTNCPTIKHTASQKIKQDTSFMYQNSQNIYTVRHKLYSSDNTPVSVDAAKPVEYPLRTLP